ncbi:hypothetical protein [Streptomyces mirabilis]|uniref:hypothetical protein n=1 Tax=Streptomyces mirabilis TaxID=68239 RepID=UPI003689B98B
MRDVVRETVAEVAPDELIVVEGLCRFDDDRVARLLAGRTGRHEPLGFGLEEVAAMVTPIVWTALDEAARQAAGAAVGTAVRRSARWLRTITRGPAAPQVLPALTSGQLQTVRERVLELAAESGIAPEAAAALAERLVARLVLGAGGESTGERRDDEPADVEESDGVGEEPPGGAGRTDGSASGT